MRVSLGRFLVFGFGCFCLAVASTAIGKPLDEYSPPEIPPDAWLSLEGQTQEADMSESVPAALSTEAVLKLMSSSRFGDDFGHSIDIDGDTAVVGARFESDYFGAAYVFERNLPTAGAWGLVKRLVGSDSGEGHHFGSAVAVAGDTIIIGSPGGGGGFGAAHVFYRDQGGTDNWGEVQAVTPGELDSAAGFGSAVDVAGDFAIIGAPRDGLGATKPQAGSAHILSRDQGGADMWGIVKKLIASDAEVTDQFGSAVTIGGDIAAVGSPQEGAFHGAVYVFEQDHSTSNAWGQRRKLSLPVTDNDAKMGSSVSVEGNLLLVGAPYADVTAGANLGAAILYGRDQGGANTWGEVKTLVSGETETYEKFGLSVSLNDQTAAVAAMADDDDGYEYGAVYVFNQYEGGAGNWGEAAEFYGTESPSLPNFGYALALDQDTLLVRGGGFSMTRNGGIVSVHDRDTGGSDAWGETNILLDDWGNQFGWSIAVDLDTLVVGAWGARDACPASFGCNSGAAYVFERVPKGNFQSEAWRFVKRLTASDAALGDQFGWAVDVSGDTILVGARGAGTGKAYVFERDYNPADPPTPAPDNWGQRTILVGEASGDEFGGSVAIDEDTAIVGAPAASSYWGAAYVFTRDQGGADMWGQVREITPPDSSASDFFGLAVDVHGDSAIVGMPGFDGFAGADDGIAYVFDRTTGGPENWGYQAYFAPVDVPAYGQFGGSVALHGDTAVVGSASDVLAADAYPGAAYVFGRDQGGAGAWGQVRKLQPSDPEPNDDFGSAVAINWDAIVVGAWQDDDACPADPDCDSGSAYLFERNIGGSGMWGQSAKLAANDALALRRFGRAVAIDRLTTAVGAPFDLDACALGTDCRPGSAYPYLFSSDIYGRDLGDLPDGYFTTLANSGPYHWAYPWVTRLGTAIDTEADATPSTDAAGDDLAGIDDEDGVTFLDPLEPGTTARVQIDVTAPAVLGGWIDFAGNGHFWDTEDWLDGGTYEGIVLAAGSNVLDVSVPASAVSGTDTYARFRIASLDFARGDPDQPWSVVPYQDPNYPVPDGEVEDYAVTIGGADEFDFGDAPDPTYPTLLVNNGARHNVSAGGPYLGAAVDSEADGQPTGTSDGDDLAGLPDDEDGVVFTSTLDLGKTASVAVTASAASSLDAWIDFNGDGDWEDAGEQAFASQVLVAGVNNLNFAIPAAAGLGTTFGRFRLSTAGALSPTGEAPDGEVEDYAVTITASSTPPDNLDLPDTMLDHPETYEACNSISAISGFHVVSPGSAVFQAGTSIVIGNGFALDAGCDFTTVLEIPVGCP